MEIYGLQCDNLWAATVNYTALLIFNMGYKTYAQYFVVDKHDRVLQSRWNRSPPVVAVKTACVGCVFPWASAFV